MWRLVLLAWLLPSVTGNCDSAEEFAASSMLFRLSGDSDGAHEALEEAAKLCPSNCKYWVLLGDSALAMKLPDRAYEAFEQALKTDPIEAVRTHDVLKKLRGLRASSRQPSNKWHEMAIPRLDDSAFESGLHLLWPSPIWYSEANLRLSESGMNGEFMEAMHAEIHRLLDKPFNLVDITLSKDDPGETSVLRGSDWPLAPNASYLRLLYIADGGGDGGGRTVFPELSLPDPRPQTHAIRIADSEWFQFDAPFRVPLDSGVLLLFPVSMRPSRLVNRRAGARVMIHGLVETPRMGPHHILPQASCLEPSATNPVLRWPAPVLLHEISADSSLNEQLKTLILSLEQSGLAQMKSNKGGWQSEADLFKAPLAVPFRVLRTQIFDAIYRMMRGMGTHSFLRRFPLSPGPEHHAGDLQVELIHVWACVNRHLDYNTIHTHPGGHISGVYYVEGDDMESLILHDPNTNSLSNNGSVYAVTATSGRIVLFPSWLSHEVLPYQGSGQRIAISFNANVHFENTVREGPLRLLSLDP